jgi:hypothetical protein
VRDSWSLALSQEHKLEAFENKELEEISGTEKDIVTLKIKILHSY